MKRAPAAAAAAPGGKKKKGGGRRGSYSEDEYTYATANSYSGDGDGKGAPEKASAARGVVAGPILDRSCTDILFLLLFILLWLAMGFTMILAFNNGNPDYLLYGIDSDGNICGVDNRGEIPNGIDMRGRDFLFFGNPANLDQAQICVAACPKVGFSSTSPDFNNVYCKNNFTGTPTLTDVFVPGLCLLDCPCYGGYNSDDVLRRCIPGAGVVAESATDSEVSQVVFSDVNEAKWIILACAGIAFILAFVWLFIVRYTGGCMVWTTVVAVFLVAIAVTAFLWIEALEAKDEYDSAASRGQGTDSQEAQYKTMLGFAILATAGVLVLFVVLIFMRTKIQMAIELIEEATYALADMPGMLVVPMCIFVLLAGFYAVWITGAVYLATAGDRSFDENNTYRGIEDEGSIKYYQAFWFFAMLWNVAFILGLNEMILGGAVASWYFKGPKGENMPDWPVLASVKRTLRYHLGTIAFGSLIIAIVQFIRACVRALEENLKGKENAFLQFVFKCIQYCLACVERFLKFISRNAYIMCAIDGTNFCTAARDAFNLLLRYALSLTAVQFVSNFLIILGKLAVTATTAGIAWLWLREKNHLEFFAIPLVIIAILAWAIATAFFSVFEMAIDTIFLCFCDDIERYNAAFASDDLQKFVAKIDGGKRDEKKRRAKADAKAAAKAVKAAAK